MRTMALLTAVLAAVSSTATAAEMPDGWHLERDVDPPSYAVIVPDSTDTNLDSVVLACEPTETGRVLQLQLYLTDDGPLLPRNVRTRQIQAHPRVEVMIDNRTFPTQIMFSDEYAVVADGEEEMSPALTQSFLEAMAVGQTMTLRFDLVGESPGQQPAFDGEAVLDLRAGVGGAAVSAVGRCAVPPAEAPNIAQAPNG